jgi:hypothetical protein
MSLDEAIAFALEGDLPAQTASPPFLPAPDVLESGMT